MCRPPSGRQSNLACHWPDQPTAMMYEAAAVSILKKGKSRLLDRPPPPPICWHVPLVIETSVGSKSVGAAGRAVGPVQPIPRFPLERLVQHQVKRLHVGQDRRIDLAGIAEPEHPFHGRVVGQSRDLPLQPQTGAGIGPGRERAGASGVERLAGLLLLPLGQQLVAGPVVNEEGEGVLRKLRLAPLRHGLQCRRPRGSAARAGTVRRARRRSTSAIRLPGWERSTQESGRAPASSCQGVPYGLPFVGGRVGRVQRAPPTSARDRWWGSRLDPPYVYIPTSRNRN